VTTVQYHMAEPYRGDLQNCCFTYLPSCIVMLFVHCLSCYFRTPW